MKTYIVEEQVNCIRTITFSINAESEEEALENYPEGEIVNEEYEPSGFPTSQIIETM